MDSIRQSTVERASSIFQEKTRELFNIWEETGIKEEVLSTYADQILNHLRVLMQDMIDESEEKKGVLVKNVKGYVHTARKLSKELGIEFASDTYNDLPLMDLEIALKNKVDELHHLKDERLKLVQELLTKEIEICKKLGVKPTGFQSELPTEEEVEEFDSHLKQQESEIKRFSELFKDTRRIIIKMMEELQISPALDFEKTVCHDHNNFVYSQNNMTKLRDLKGRLKDQVEHAKMEVEDKRAMLISLWDYLDEPMEYRQAFFEACPGYSLATINALKAEIQKCKEKRSQNIGNYVKKVRAEIENLWKLCKYSEQQKKSFAAMKCHTYTEDLLTLHEIEAENLRKFYESNRKIFEDLDEWEIQFEKLKELDQRANDPDRYHNRGGQLLMEEKERKAAEKKLPKLENQLYNLVDAYETSHRKVFLVHGYSLREYMEHKREIYEIEKENLKAARKQAKDKSVKKTPLSTSKRTPGASMLRITPASNRLLRTPGAAANITRMTPSAKRKLPYDSSPNTTDNKKRAISTDKHKNTVLHNKIRRSGRTPGGITLNGSGRVKASAGKKKRKSRNDTLLSVSSYGNFQEHLENRDELRSSILPEKGSEKGGLRSGTMKTPIKPVRRKVLAISTPTTANATRTLRGTPRSPRLRATPRLVPHQNSSPIEL